MIGVNLSIFLISACAQHLTLYEMTFTVFDPHEEKDTQLTVHINRFHVLMKFNKYLSDS